MSVGVMAWVWKHSRAKSTARLVLLAIADCANDRGAEAYPSTATLAAKTALSERAVRAAVAGLETLGELRVEYKAGRRGCNRYEVVMRDPAGYAGSTDQYPAGDAGYPEPPAGSDPEPAARNPAGYAGSGVKDPAPRARNPARRAPEPSLRPSSGSSTSGTHSSSEVAARPDVDEICTHLADKIVANGSKRPTITEKWRTAARLLLDADGKTVNQVIAAIDWCQTDDFWRSNILSMPKLREKYDQLRLAAQRSPNGRASPSTVDRRVGEALAAGERAQARIDAERRGITA